jgi:hypothetical protein
MTFQSVGDWLAFGFEILDLYVIILNRPPPPRDRDRDGVSRETGTGEVFREILVQKTNVSRLGSMMYNS